MFPFKIPKTTSNQTTHSFHLRKKTSISSLPLHLYVSYRCSWFLLLDFLGSLLRPFGFCRFLGSASRASAAPQVSWNLLEPGLGLLLRMERAGTKRQTKPVMKVIEVGERKVPRFFCVCVFFWGVLSQLLMN